jgi:hypothetical protein
MQNPRLNIKFFYLGFAGRKKMEIRSAFETLVRLAVVEQIADAVHRVLKNGSGGKYDHSDLWIHEWDDIESRYEAGELVSEAEVFACVHDNLGICQSA